MNKFSDLRAAGVVNRKRICTASETPVVSISSRFQSDNFRARELPKRIYRWCPSIGIGARDQYSILYSTSREAHAPTQYTKTAIKCKDITAFHLGFYDSFSGYLLAYISTSRLFRNCNDGIRMCSSGCVRRSSCVSGTLHWPIDTVTGRVKLRAPLEMTTSSYRLPKRSSSSHWHPRQWN